jgi:hypothetical protein
MEQETTIIEPPRDPNGKIRWLEFKQDSEHFIAYIEAEVRSFMEEGHPLSFSALYRAKRTLLIRGISHYPGRLRGLKDNMGIGNRLLPRGYWQDITNVQEAAKQFIAEHGGLSVTLVREHGATMLLSAAARYPGGLNQLRRDIGIATDKRRRGHWTPENVLVEARSFYEEHGDLSTDLLKEKGAKVLKGAVGRYPGGLTQIRKTLGLQPRATSKGDQYPARYWTPEKIEQAIREYAESAEVVGIPDLEKCNLPLVRAIFLYYPEKFGQLLRNSGIEFNKMPSRYWTPEEIELQAQEYIREHGSNLSREKLIQQGNISLGNAVIRYPGGIKALKAKLGLEVIKPRGYWNIETIRTEAAKFLEEFGFLTNTALRGHRRADIIEAISRYYPGGLASLRKDLDVKTELSSIEANKDLEQLLEE